MNSHRIDPIRPSGGLRRLRAGLPIDTVKEQSVNNSPRTLDQFESAMTSAIEEGLRDERTVLVMRISIRPLPRGSGTNDRSGLAPELKQRLTQADTSVVAYQTGTEQILAFVPALRRRSDGDEMVQLVVDALRPALVLNGLPHYLSPRVGAALLDRENPSTALLLEGTELALAETDSAHPGMMFHPYQRVRHQRHAEMENDLRSAVLNAETSVAFQPSVSLETGKIVALEAFARWSRDGKGEVPTIDFIRSAEELGVIHQLGRQVLEKALFTTSDWVDAGLLDEVTLWLNVSPSEVKHPDFPKMVSDAIEINPKVRVGIELTPMPPNDDRHIPDVIRALVSRGARASIGDFGTGYIDVAQLHQLPFDMVTLDRSLTRQIGSSDQAADLLQILIELANRLGLQTTAQGIENPDQISKLALMGCKNAQGYLLARPLMTEEMTALLNEQKASGLSLLQNS